jgi:hypothetical protein
MEPGPLRVEAVPPLPRSGFWRWTAGCGFGGLPVVAVVKRVMEREEGEVERVAVLAGFLGRLGGSGGFGCRGEGGPARTPAFPGGALGTPGALAGRRRSLEGFARIVLAGWRFPGLDGWRPEAERFAAVVLEARAGTLSSRYR